MPEINFKEINYSAVEVIRKTSENIGDVECGLFVGICRKTNASKKVLNFLVVATKRTTVKLYNLDEFNILTVDILSEDTRYMTVFTRSDKDQAIAIKVLDSVRDKLQEESRLDSEDLKKELIDISTYTKYASEILLGDDLSTKLTTNDYDNITNSSNTTRVSNINTAVVEKEEPAVLHFKRKGKLPSQIKLDEIKNKVITMGNEATKVNPLPIPKCDLEDTT